MLAVVALLVMLGVVALLHGFGRDADARLASILPMDQDHGGRLLALFSGSSLWAIGLGLLRSKRLAWYLGIVTFATALVLQVAVLHHPVGGAIALAVIAALLVDRRRYSVRSAPMWRGILIVSIGIVLVLAIIRIGIEVVGSGHWPTPIAAVGALAAGAAAGLGVDDDAIRAASGPAGVATISGLLLLVARIPVVLSAIGILTPAADASLSPGDAKRARTVLRNHGEGALLPFQEGDDVSLFLGSTGEAVVVHARAGRAAIVLGDPVGNRNDAFEALCEFMAVARRNDHLVGVYQASHGGRAVLQAAGFNRLYRIGQEAIIDLSSFDTLGSNRANLRHTITRFHRGGGTVRWFGDGLDQSAMEIIGPGLAAIDATWRSVNGPQLGFTVGVFRLDDLRSIPVSIAFDGSGDPIGFVTFRSMGVGGGAVLDLIRRQPASIPGAVEAALAFAAGQLRASGATELSLGLAPLRGLKRAGGPIEERLLRSGGDALKRWYDIDGLAFFKAKFDPRWVPRYVAAVHRRDAVPIALALLRLHLGKRGSLAGVVKSVGSATGRAALQLVPRRGRRAG